jgi:geranylgeranyl pyrophosphate synthase
MKENERSSIERARTIFLEKGRFAYEAAKEAILKEKLGYEPVREALTYFIGEVWHNCEHPALLSLACESVGGTPESTTLFGASFVLLTGAADIHDDIIDRSKTKGSKATVFGRYEGDMALLVGDALLVEGFALLNRACDELPKEQARTIVTMVKDAFFEIGNAEAEETSLRGNWDADPEVCFSVMRRKAAIAVMATRIGAMVGKGSLKQIAALSEYGRTLALLANLRNEFVDIYETRELKNRMRNECLPLPLLYAFRNQKAKSQITLLLKKKRFTAKDASEAARITMETEEVISLMKRMKRLSEQSTRSMEVVRNQEARKLLHELLIATLEGL